MARAKLNQGEVAGIRLIADLFVLRELKMNVLAKNMHFKIHLNELEEHLKTCAPKVFAAEEELQKQINLVKDYWIAQLGADNGK